MSVRRTQGLCGLTMAMAMAAASPVLSADPASVEAQIQAIEVGPLPVPVVPYPSTYTDAWLRNHFNQRTLTFKDYAALEGQGVAFVGDSITEGGDWAALFPGVEVRNYGIGGDRSDGVLARRDQVVAAKPARIILLIGTNDLSNGYTPEQIATNVGQLLDQWKQALPQAQMVVQSVLPRQVEFDGRIRQLNGLLQQTARSRGADWLDIHTAFLFENGRLDPAVTEDDLHLTLPGYERWRTLIEPCVRLGQCGS
jgi:lysophospholipase L1-like esterase